METIGPSAAEEVQDEVICLVCHREASLPVAAAEGWESRADDADPALWLCARCSGAALSPRD